MRDQTARTSFPPQNLGKYEVKRLLGEGSMGMVYEGYDPTLEREVAIKVMAGASLYDDTMRERFKREAKAVAKLKHPNIVMIHELGEEESSRTPFIAMELLEGEDLAAIIESATNPSIATKLDIIAQVCRGLEHAHEAGIVHRDIKPANIYVTKDGTAKIMDFGVARWTRTAQTQAGIVVGTAGYIPPEQLRGNGVDGRSDLFSLGVVLYEVLTNELLYSGDTLETIFFKTLSKATPRLALPDGDELPGLQAILDRALAKEIEDRYPTASDMGQAIEAFARSHQTLLTEMTVLKGRDPDAPSQSSFRRSSSQNPTRRVEIPTLAPNAPQTAGAPGFANTLDARGNEARASGPASRASSRPRGRASGSMGRRHRQRMPAFVPALLVAVVAAALGAYIVVNRPALIFGQTPDGVEGPGSGSTQQPPGLSNGPRPAPPTDPAPAPAPDPDPEALDPSPDSAEALNTIIADAALALSASDFDRAKTLIAEGEALSPGNTRLQQLTERVATLEAEERRRQAAARLIKQGERQLEAGDYDAAISSFRGAIGNAPDNGQATSGLDRAIAAKTAAAAEPVRPQPEESPRRIVEGRTEYVPAVPDNELAGFVPEDGIEVGGSTESAPGQLTIELTPTDAKPGEPYIVRVRVFNQTYSAILLTSLQLVSEFEGGVSGKGQNLPVRMNRIEPQSTVVVYEASGTWKESQNSGAIEATVRLSDGAQLKKSISW